MAYIDRIKTSEWKRCVKCKRSYEEDTGMVKCLYNHKSALQNRVCNRFEKDEGIQFNNEKILNIYQKNLENCR